MNFTTCSEVRDREIATHSSNASLPEEIFSPFRSKSLLTLCNGQTTIDNLEQTSFNFEEDQCHMTFASENAMSIAVLIKSTKMNNWKFHRTLQITMNR